MHKPLSVIVVAALLALAIAARAEPPRPRLFLPGQRSIQVRDPSQISTSGAASLPAPRTVSDRGDDSAEIHLSLDEAIRIGLANSEVIRILAGVTAAGSGQTVYDVAITNTAIDEQQARFDPFLTWQNSFNRIESPVANLDPLDANFARIEGIRADDYTMTADLSKTTATGGVLSLGVNTNPARFQPGLFALSPQNRNSVDLSFTQPLFRGGGIASNQVPIVVARIDTERSYFQYKDGVQEMVQGIIAAYWSLVFARTDEWARQQQVQQAQFAYDQAEARFQAKTVSRGVVAQARVSLGNFQTALTAARNNVLQREAALRNMLGLPPADGKRLVPVTPPAAERIDFDWESLLQLAEQNRPDVIERKLIIESDEQQVRLALNQASPTVDATMLYRWNALDGTTPTGAQLSTTAGQFTDWTLGVNVSVPLSLRQERAALRRQELLVARDVADLRQSLHGMTHNLATSLRNLEQLHEQYREFHAIRNDALFNLQERQARWTAGGVGGVSYVDLLLAIQDWGNTISAEAQALTQYNTELAILERETGTILEAHGVRFYEERFGSIGPLGRFGPDRPYPSSLPPAPNADRYPRGDEPAENYFELDDPRALPAPPTPEDLPLPGPLPLPPPLDPPPNESVRPASAIMPLYVPENPLR